MTLTEDQAQPAPAEWNDTAADFPSRSTVHALFCEQAARTPERVAIEFGAQRLRYRELDQRSNQLARHLQDLGVAAGSRVGVSMERSLELVIGLLGVLKAGASYVPFDPAYPSERLAYMAKDASPQAMLTLSRLRDSAPETSGPTIRVDADWDAIAEQDTGELVDAAGPEDLAYVLYTSGTTGRPKGVMVPHRAVCNRLHRGQTTYPMAESDRMLQITSLNFDVSVWEVFAPLLAGARVVLAPRGAELDAARLVALLADRAISVVGFVPSMLDPILEQRELSRCRGTLRRVYCGGEALDAPLVRRFYARLDAELYNLYGPTEATIDATRFACTQSLDGATVPIGRPIANTRVYILNEDLEPLPVGEDGELFVGGDSLALGYLNQPELTEERFIPDPFASAPGQRLYRTGDLARYRKDGNIEFRGRIDDQIKIRGFRVELGEIESRLKEHPGVRDAVVVHQHAGAAPTIDPDALIEGLAALPETDVEALISELEKLTDAEADFLWAHETDPQVRRRTMIRRHPEFEHFLRFADDEFIRPPNDNQRNWILHRALEEFADDLRHLHEVSKRFVTGSERPEMSDGWSQSEAEYDDSQLVIQGQQVMQDWERPMMKAMAEIVCETRGDVVEVGFGMGISASAIQDNHPRSHTIIEFNENVIRRFETWRRQYPDSDIRLVRGKWQDAVAELETNRYDGVFFDTYSSDEDEYLNDVLNGITFAESFFPTAAALLRTGGVFSYYTNEIDSFSRRHQRLIFEHFDSFNLSVVRSMTPPDDCNYWWADSMAVVKAIK
jgi:amino acid adenylation domain-containing protein